MMNKALPKIKETAEEIRERLKTERNSKRQNRLQALYLIVTKQAKSRTQVAQMLGKNRNTISDWVRLYETEGLEKFLEIYKSPGAKTKISEAALADILAILGTEKGSRTYKEIHQMVVKKHKIDIHYSNVHDLVRYKLEAKAKVPRPSNPKKLSRSRRISRLNRSEVENDSQ
jgi:transposase